MPIQSGDVKLLKSAVMADVPEGGGAPTGNTIADGVSNAISAALPGQRAPTALQVALARGHRWLRQIEGGQARNLAEIADREKIDRSYVSRMVNLTTLAPDIQAAILDETLPEEVALFDLAIDTPLCWQAQRQRVADVVAKVRAGKTQPAAQT